MDYENHCIICREVEDSSVGLYLHLNESGICNECATDDTFNQIIRSDDEGLYHLSAGELQYILEAFSKHVMDMTWDQTRLDYAHGRVSDDFYNFLAECCRGNNRRSHFNALCEKVRQENPDISELEMYAKVRELMD